MEALEQSNVFTYHRQMLQDAERVDRYREAIHAVVKPGDVVVDIGTGTGLLAYFACQAGARRVYAIEAGPIVRLARELCAANGLDDRVTFIDQLSLRAELPERADVLVTETLWSFGIGEGMVGWLQDARERMLKPEAAVIPAAVDLFVAPLDVPRLHGTVTTTPEDRNGLDFSVMRDYAVNQIQLHRVQASELLGEPVQLVRIVLGEAALPDLRAEAALEASREGTLNALAGWFEAELAPGIRLGNAPPARESHWAQAVFPLERPVPVRPGTEIAVRLNTVGNGSGWRWATEVDGQRFDQTSVFGFPHDAQAHRRRAASARPTRAALGEAMLFVLSRLDGESSVEEIAEQLEAGSDLFMQPEAAAQFVRDAAERYGA